MLKGLASKLFPELGPNAIRGHVYLLAHCNVPAEGIVLAIFV